MEWKEGSGNRRGDAGLGRGCVVRLGVFCQKGATRAVEKKGRVPDWVGKRQAAMTETRKWKMTCGGGTVPKQGPDEKSAQPRTK